MGRGGPAVNAPGIGLTFRLLGEPAAYRDGRELPVQRGQAWLLLAFLIDRRGSSVDRSESTSTA